MRQSEVGNAGKLIKRYMLMSFCCIGTGAVIFGGNGKDKAGAEGMCRAHQIADIKGLADALNTDAEITARDIRHDKSIMAASLQAVERQGKLSHYFLIFMDQMRQ